VSKLLYFLMSWRHLSAGTSNSSPLPPLDKYMLRIRLYICAGTCILF